MSASQSLEHVPGLATLSTISSPPYSLEAEQSVLGGLMLDNSAWDLIAERLSDDDFFRREHKLIFRGIADLAAKQLPFDVVTLADAMPEVEECGGLAYLGDLARNTPSVANIVTYAEIVGERAHLRRLMQVGFACSRDAAAADAVAAEVQDSIEQRLFALGQDRRVSEFADIREAVGRVIDRIDHQFNNPSTLTGVPSGLDDLDGLTLGFQDADLIIVGARPSMGKTAFALNLIDAALGHAKSKTVQVYSLEMPTDQLIQRMLSLLGGIDGTRLRSGQLTDDDWPKLTYAASRMASYEDRLVIDDTAGLTPTELRAKARRAARKFGKPSLIMVDYLQMMRVPGCKDRVHEIGQISGALKALAKEMECPVVALSQLNRSLESRPNKRPLNSDLRESGAVEQDADLILFLYRDEYYHPESEFKGIAEIIIGKQRNGPLGTARVAFIANQTRFENLAPGRWNGGFE